MTSLRIQSILFHNDTDSIERALRAVQRAVDLAISAGIYSSVSVCYGDCSPFPIFDKVAIDVLTDEHNEYFAFKVRHFGQNLGSANGHNTLLEDSFEDHVVIMNPDVLLAPNALIELARPMKTGEVGMVEARQLPIEHPKDYDVRTGETCWATTACALIPREVFERVGKFDNDTFFLYCDDVDFSWRVRLAGYRVIYQPFATVFHDKRLSNDGGWLPSAAEKYYSAEAALLLPYKWSRADISRQLAKEFESSNLDYLRKAAAEFRTRELKGTLPAQLDSEHAIAKFVGNMYANHRFAI
jgi:GT2 family glycosyltransferase